MDDSKNVENMQKLRNFVTDHFTLVCIGLLAFAFIVRILYDFVFPGRLSMDAQSYYRVAINIVNGIGYSDHTEAPYLPFYFREPLTSYMIAACVYVCKLFSGIGHIDYPTSWSVAEMLPFHQHAILLVKVLSSLLQVIGLWLFSKVVINRIGKTTSAIFLAVAAIYFPLILYTSLLLREVYVFFLLMSMTYLWDKFMSTDILKYLVATSLCGGILLQCLHLYWLILPIYMGCILVHYWKKWKKATLAACLMTVLFFLPSVPWVCKVYNYYPDIRVAKTLGSALTVDYTNGLNAYRAHGVDPYYVKQGEMDTLKVWTEIFSIEDPSKNFQYTFDGTYKSEAARLNAANTTQKLLEYYLYRIVLAFRNTVFIVGITYDYEIFFGNYSPKEIAKFFFCLPFILMGLLALIGLWPFLKKHWIIMPTFLYNALFFFAYGDEERRQYVLVPWIIIMAIYIVGQWIKIQKENNGINHQLSK